MGDIHSFNTDRHTQLLRYGTDELPDILEFARAMGWQKIVLLGINSDRL